MVKDVSTEFLTGAFLVRVNRKILQNGRTILFISSQDKKRRGLAGGLVQLGFQVLSAIGQKQGLRLLFRHRPDLTLLDLADAHAAADMLARIRLLTDTPVVVLLDAPLPPTVKPLAENVALVVWPATPLQVLAQAGGLKPRSDTLPDPARGERTRSGFGPLKTGQLAAIDNALWEIGESGEVHLVLDDGRLKFISRIKDEPLGSASSVATDDTEAQPGEQVLGPAGE